MQTNGRFGHYIVFHIIYTTKLDINNVSTGINKPPIITADISEFGEITQNTRPLRRSRSFKVINFYTNQKSICDFLLLNNTNLTPTLHRFQVMADYWSNFRCHHGSASI